MANRAPGGEAEKRDSSPTVRAPVRPQAPPLLLRVCTHPVGERPVKAGKD